MYLVLIDKILVPNVTDNFRRGLSCLLQYFKECNILNIFDVRNALFINIYLE